jgi:hypothetical protein
MVANSSNFQTWTGTANATDAMTYVHYNLATTFDKPYAVTQWAENFRRIKHAGGSRNRYRTEGDLILMFRDSITETNEADEAKTFMNTVGAIIEDMEAISGTATGLDVQEYALEDGPWRPEEDEVKSLEDGSGNLIGDYYHVAFRIIYNSGV